MSCAALGLGIWILADRSSFLDLLDTVQVFALSILRQVLFHQNPNLDGHHGPHLQQHRRPDFNCFHRIHYNLLLWMLRSLQGEQMYGRNGMIEIYTDQESDFIHLLQNKQALRSSIFFILLFLVLRLGVCVDGAGHSRIFGWHDSGICFLFLFMPKLKN